MAARRQGIDRERLAALVAAGLSQRRIAAEVGVSQATVRHWLRRYGLRTAGIRSRSPEAESAVRECPRHGLTEFVRYRRHDHFRCLSCRKQRVSDRRREIKALLVEEAGGCCRLCGYDRYVGALHFHHLDPSAKEFGLGVRGVARGLERSRAEARKCILLCGNCHAEVEAGVATLPGAPGSCSE